MNSRKGGPRLARLWLFAIGLVPAFAGCAHAMERMPLTIATSGGKTVTIDVEVARTQAEQQKGYMGRRTIADGTGMIFAFPDDRQLHFWMKDTPHPLSIAYIDSAGVIREIRDMTPFSLEPVSSERSVRFALEVPSGWFARAGVAVGDRLAPDSLGAIRR